MRIAYVNANYQIAHTGGGHVHMEQFIANAIALGHEVWVYPGNKYPGTHVIPTSRLAHIRAMQQMDALYVRIESSFPSVGKWALPLWRYLYKFPLVVWEFNTIPAHGRLHGRSEQEIQLIISKFKHYGRGCDLAICMTESLADFVRTQLDINRILIVPNGSDPDLFRPETPVVGRLSAFKDKFNIIWIGSGKETWHDLNLLRDSASILQITKPGDFYFHILGPDLVGKMGEMPDNVFYWGPEYYNQLPGWLSGMDVGLSVYKPGPADVATPLKVFDYLASGLPVISTPTHFVVELNHRLGCSELNIPYGDPTALAEILLHLARDRERVKKLGLAGRQLVIDQYNWRRAVRDTFNEMEMILREKRGL